VVAGPHLDGLTSHHRGSGEGQAELGSILVEETELVVLEQCHAHDTTEVADPRS